MSPASQGAEGASRCRHVRYNVSDLVGHVLDPAASSQPVSAQRTDWSTLLDTSSSGQVNLVDSGRADVLSASEQRSLARALSDVRAQDSVCQQKIVRLKEDIKRHQETIQKEKQDREKAAALLAELRNINKDGQSKILQTKAELENERKNLKRLRERGYKTCIDIILDP